MNGIFQPNNLLNSADGCLWHLSTVTQVILGSKEPFPPLALLKCFHLA